MLVYTRFALQRKESMLCICSIWTRWSACWTICEISNVFDASYFYVRWSHIFVFPDAFPKESTSTSKTLGERSSMYYYPTCIAVCGIISQYNIKEPKGVHNLMQLVVQTDSHGRISSSWLLLPLSETPGNGHTCLKEGKIVYVEDIAESLKNTPAALVGVFTGRNVGKHLVVVAGEWYVVVVQRNDIVLA